MAKKKKTKKKVHHRHKVGAINLKGAMPILGAVVGTLGGLIGGKLANNAVTAKMPKIPAVAVGAAEVAVGTVVALKARPVWLKAVGVGFAASGGWLALGNAGLKVLPAAIGYGPDPDHSYRGLQGFRDVPKIGFPKPGNIGAMDRERIRHARLYAGIYGG